MDWEKLFTASANKLKSSLEEARASLGHRGLKGAANEQAFAEWISAFLPGGIEVSTGELIDSEGGRSRQVDVLLYDGTTAPRFLSRGDINVLPIEPVYAAIELKTYLDKGEIEAAFENMKSVKALKKLAFHKSLVPALYSHYGGSYEHWPVQFFVFAYESDSLENVLRHVNRLNASQPLDQRIDMVCILDKGLIVNTSPAGLEPIPSPHTNLIAKPSSKALLTFYALIAHLFGQVRSEPVSIHPYLRHISH